MVSKFSKIFKIAKISKNAEKCQELFFQKIFPQKVPWDM